MNAFPPDRCFIVTALALTFVLVGCGSDRQTPDARTDASVPMVTLSGRVAVGGVPDPNATVSVLERPDLTRQVDADGRYTLELVQNTATTVEITSPGQIPIRTQTIRLARDADMGNLSTLTMTGFDDLSALGPGASGSVFLVQVFTMGSCDLAGAHLRTTPASGTVVYAGPTGEPDPSLTSMGAVPVAYIVDVIGTVTPSVVDLGAPCSALPFPVVTSTTTYEGPIATADRTAVKVALFAAP